VQLYRSASLPAGGFAGVPLFQAEGLTVKGANAQYTPLFFSKEDLDTALVGAYLGKDDQQQAEIRAKAQRARAELAEAQAAAAAAIDAKVKRAAEKKAEAAQQRADRYTQRMKELTAKKKLPRVDVGSLEEVLVRMEKDEKGEWGDVMFVPPGKLAPAARPAK
jgi:multidrug efflux pump subunit AcrA (membrane-fusion protein)